MTKYSRKVILNATDLLAHSGHDGIDRFLLEYNLEGQCGSGYTMRDRANSVARFLLEHPEQQLDGQNLADIIVEQLAAEAVRNSTQFDIYNYQMFSERYTNLNRALEIDGFTVEDGQLRRTLPAVLHLPEADDEVHTILIEHHLDVSRGHLDQAISAHGRGEWAGANGQLRTFTESLFNEIATAISTRLMVTAPATGNASRIWLAHLTPPLFGPELNEWTGQGTGFIEGFFSRLHPAGPHPGLSDEEDSTFRLHLVLLVARSLLHRFQMRLR